MKTITLMFVCVLAVIMGIFMGSGCRDDSDSSKTDDSVHLRMLDVHNTYLASLDTEISDHIAAQLPAAESRIAARIDQEAAAVGHSLSPQPVICWSKAFLKITPGITASPL